MKHIITVLLLCILGSLTTAQAITPAGTIITNHVEASYIDPATGEQLTTLSNEVSITLRPVAAVLLEQDLQQVVVPGETLYLTHTLSNFGNVPDSFVLILENLLDDDADLQALTLYHDINANGVLDNDEPEISTTQELASGSSLQLVIKGVVADTSSAGSELKIKLSALSQNNVLGTKVVSNVDTLTISDGDSSQQQTQIRFLTPTHAAMQDDGTPDFYNNEDFVDAQQYRIDTATQGNNYDPVRDGIYVEIHADDIETVSSKVAKRLQPIKLVSLLSVETGDSLQIAIREIAANTGIYRSIRPIRLSSINNGDGQNCPNNPDAYQESQPDYTQDASECVLRSVPNDRLRVTVSAASATTVVDTAVVEPLGVVFDTSSGNVLADMQVTFMAADNTVARDPVSGNEIEAQITDTEGQFHFPVLLPGSYYLAVSGKNTGQDAGQKSSYQFPSLIPPSAFPDRAVSDYSYGENGFSGTNRSGLFSITADKPTLTIDIPVDPALSHQGQQLVLDKQVSTTEAMLGDLLTYTITISNRTGEDIKDAHVYDYLPAGFKLVASSVRLSGELRNDLATVTGLTGRSVDFLIGDLPNESVLELVYVLRVSAEASEGDAINRAYLTAKTLANEPLQSATTHAKVRIRNRGVLSSEGILFGKVYFDKSCDYAPERLEGLLPLGGIRLYLDDGRYAITDGAGDYSFYGMEAALHTVKLDAITLPKGVKLKVVDTQQANDPYSYFIDISSGDFHRADFVAECLNGKSANKMLATIAKNNKALRDTDFLDEAGSKTVVNKNIYAELEAGTLSDDPEDKKQKPVESMPISKKAVKKITYKQGKKGTWLWPKGNISTDGRFMAVVRAGVKKPILYVNGEAVSIENMGEQLGNKKSRAQLLAWYGVALEEGENNLEIKGVGPRGKLRTLAQHTFTKPSRGVEIKITPLKEALVADGGRSSLPLKITILDKNGNAAMGDYFLTLLSSDGQWKGKDIQEATEGHQIKLSHGEKIVYLRSSGQTGKVHISVKADTMTGEIDVSQVAHLRPLFATGYVNISAHSGGRRHGRSKFFIKGRVMGDKHLTLSFDSDKPYAGSNEAYREELDKSYYSIHGDASLRGYEARSRSKLFAKIEKGKRSIMWGDYQTDTLATADLARVQRTLNGANVNVDTGKTQFQLFAAQENNTHITEEFRGNGTASNYQLDKKGLVPNSEVIELIIRDRENTGLIISSETLSRLVDFTLDPITGYLTFHRVIPSLDNDLNPVYIRVSYNMESDGEKYLVSGARVQRSLTDEITVGGSYTHDAHTENGSDLVGGYLTYKPGAKTEITASTAQMEHTNGDEKGNAYRLTARHAWSDTATSDIVIGRTDKGFTNSNSGIIADRQEVKLTHTQKLDKKTHLKVEGTHSESLSQQQQSQTLGATLQTRKGKWLLEGGMRHIEQKSQNTRDKTDTVRMGVKRSISVLDHKGRVGLGYEQDIQDSTRNYLTADAEMAINKKSSIYSRYETGSDLTGALGLSQNAKSDRFVFGAKSRVSPEMELYSEYRSRDLTGTRSAETASGLRGAYEVEKGLKLTPSLEVVKTTEGENLQDSIAASLAVTDLRDENNRKTLRVETRQGEETDYYGIEGSYITKLDDAWSGLIREELQATTSDVDGDYGSHTFTLGLSQRQKDQGKHNGLYLYQWKEDRGINTSSDKTIHVLSTHQHYQATDELELSARLGGKIQTSHLDGQNYRMDTVLLDGRTNYEINDKVDVFARGGVLGSDHFKEQQYSAGVGINVTVKDNMRIGVGYNQTGFKDKDLDADKQNADGFFVNLILKANESWFDWMSKKKKKDVNRDSDQ